MQPGAGWTCVSGNWLPPSGGTGSTGSTCTTVSPGTGWTCVNGSWLPPRRRFNGEHLHDGQAWHRLDVCEWQLAATGQHHDDDSSCTTVSPGTGWTCVNGSWLPPLRRKVQRGSPWTVQARHGLDMRWW